MRKRGVAKAAVVLAVVFAILGGSALPGFADHGGADHLVCAYFYYEYPPGSEPEYLFDECRVGVPEDWGIPVFNAGCAEHTIGSYSIKRCSGYHVSAP